MGSHPSCCSEEDQKNLEDEDEVKEKQLIMEYWNEGDPDRKLFEKSWLGAMGIHPAIQKIFVEHYQHRDLSWKRSFDRLLTKIDGFFEYLIVGLALEPSECARACEQLGENHVKYSSKRFKRHYWNTFAACLLHTFEKEVKADRRKFGLRRFGITEAWRKLVFAVAEHMRIGYNRQKDLEIKMARY